MTYPIPTSLYHITHVNNLSGILTAQGLYCKASLREDRQQVDVSHYDLQERRRRRAVTCGPGGNLHDYVPFYFAPRSPMLYALYRNNVKGYQEGQTPIVYLVSSVQRIVQVGSAFVFSDGHPIMALSQFYTSLENLERLDWKVMVSPYWNDTAEFPNRKQLRQAEFLIHRFVPWVCIESLAVRTHTMQEQVQSIIDAAPSHLHKPVHLAQEWYF